jgi:hypothetical protein
MESYMKTIATPGGTRKGVLSSDYNNSNVGES